MRYPLRSFLPSNLVYVNTVASGSLSLTPFPLQFLTPIHFTSLCTMAAYRFVSSEEFCEYVWRVAPLSPERVAARGALTTDKKQPDKPPVTHSLFSNPPNPSLVILLDFLAIHIYIAFSDSHSCIFVSQYELCLLYFRIFQVTSSYTLPVVIMPVVPESAYEQVYK